MFVIERRPDRARRTLPPLPPDALIIVPVRNTVLFPGLVLPITLGRPKSIAAAQQAVRDQRQVGILLQRDAEVPEPDAARHAPHGHGRQHRALHHRAGRRASSGLPGRAALPDRRISERLAVLRRARAANSRSPRLRAPEIEARFVNLQGAGARGPAAAAAGAARAAGRDPSDRGARRRSPTWPSPTWT